MGSGGESSRIALVGLDGATFRVLDPLIASGVMPTLQKLREEGVQAVLRSTVPTYTPPAWVSMATGVNPGRHGIFGFLANSPQEAPTIAHSGLIDAVPMWRYLNELGLTAGVFNLPMSYPPMSVEGFMVSGGIAAGWVNPELPNFASEEGTARLVLQNAGSHYPLDTVVSYENDWRSLSIITSIQEIQEMRRRVLGALLENVEPDAIFAVFEGPDRLQHLHYQYIVECSDWYARPEAVEIRDRAFAYFAEVDRAIHDLVVWAGPDGHVVVVSDHGFGPWEKTVNVNLLLAKWGYLTLPSFSRFMRLGPVAGAGQHFARRVLPRRMLHAAKARVGARIVWSRSQAFASHVAEQGIHVNERDAMPKGILDRQGTKKVATELVQRLLELTDPDDNRPVVDEVVRREEVTHGPHLSRAPHLFPFCRDQRYELSDTLAAKSAFTDHRDRPWGYHHTDGIFIARGPGAAEAKQAEPLRIVDVLPTLFHLAGLSVPAGLDGRVVTEICAAEASSRPVSRFETTSDQERAGAYPYSPEEEAAIEESLRGLGYLE